MKPLKLKTLVDKQTGFPRKEFSKKYQKDITKFCTLKQFIDSPKTLETIECLDHHYEVIEYIAHYEVIEYIESKFLSPEECADRIERRKLIAYLDSKRSSKLPIWD